MDLVTPISNTCKPSQTFFGEEILDLFAPELRNQTFFNPIRIKYLVRFNETLHVFRICPTWVKEKQPTTEEFIDVLGGSFWKGTAIPGPVPNRW